MDKFLIEKSGPLKGSVQVSGAKNAGLPLMAACLLTDSELVLDNLPDLVDVRTMASVLENLGVEIFRERDRITLDGSKADGYTAPYRTCQHYARFLLRARASGRTAWHCPA